jgi:hypothetical protein
MLSHDFNDLLLLKAAVRATSRSCLATLQHTHTHTPHTHTHDTHTHNPHLSPFQLAAPQSHKDEGVFRARPKAVELAAADEDDVRVPDVYARLSS